MPDLNAVVKDVADYRASRISLAVFEDRFRDDFRGAYLVPHLDDLQASIESALSDYHFGEDRDEALLRQELANAIRPFVRSYTVVLDARNAVSVMDARAAAVRSVETHPIQPASQTRREFPICSQNLLVA